MARKRYLLSMQKTHLLWIHTLLLAALTGPVLWTPRSAQALPEPARQLQQMYHQQALIDRFYTAFAARDLDGMLAVYHPEIVFSDPVFGQLKGAEVGAMWAMLLKASEGRQLDITHHDVRVQNSLGLARWEARYQLAATGGRIHNRITARFGFRDGLIAEHHDSFDPARWSGMAVPVWGTLLGGQPWFQGLLQGMARRQLNSFQAAGTP